MTLKKVLKLSTRSKVSAAYQRTSIHPKTLPLITDTDTATATDMVDMEAMADMVAMVDMAVMVAAVVEVAMKDGLRLLNLLAV